MTTLIHVKDAPAGWRSNGDYLYIGRPTYLSNPFRVGRDGTRDEVIDKYRVHLRRLRDQEPQLFDDYMERAARGAILVCHCKPLACHGDVILHYLETGEL